MRLPELLLVPTLGLLTFYGVRRVQTDVQPRDSSSSEASVDSPTSAGGGARGPQRPPPTRLASVGRAPAVVDLNDLSDLQNAVLTSAGLKRMAYQTVLEKVNGRLAKLVARARDLCESSDGGEAAESATLVESTLAVSARVQTSGREILLSDVEVTPWNGAQIPEGLTRCIRNYTAQYLNAPGLDRPYPAPYPLYSGEHRILVGLQTHGSCSAPPAWPWESQGKTPRPRM
jgi:hypothetical protein